MAGRDYTPVFLRSARKTVKQEKKALYTLDNWARLHPKLQAPNRLASTSFTQSVFLFLEVAKKESENAPPVDPALLPLPMTMIARAYCFSVASSSILITLRTCFVRSFVCCC